MLYAPPIRYIEPVYRPPSEGQSLLLQVTIGCSWNSCGFCAMYRGKKFRVRDIKEIGDDIQKAASFYSTPGTAPRKIFLCDGDALAAPAEVLKETLQLISRHLPATTRVGIYASPRNVLKKTEAELKLLSNLKLKIAYLGAESGSDDVLSLINKGNTAGEIEEACRKLMSCGIKVSMIIMTGLGGRSLSEPHCSQSARLISRTAPDFLSFLTTTPVPLTPYDGMINRGKISPLTIRELLFEMRTIISGVKNPDRRIIFRANHSSNLLPLEGILPRDSKNLCAVIDNWIEECPEGLYPDQDPSLL